MKKKILSVLLAVLLVIGVMPVSVNAAASYNASKALEYARVHWNDGKGLCAEFVSDCLKAGGLNSWDTECTNLYNKLNNEVIKGARIATITYLTPEKTRNQNNSLIFDGIRVSANKDKVSKGDILFWLCQGCPHDSTGGPYQHTALVSDVSGTYVNVYQHNGAQNNSPAYVGNCYECGRRYSHMVVVHFGSSSPDYVVSVKTDQYVTVRNSGSKSYLNVSGNSSANNANITVNAWTGGSGEDFKFVKNGSGYLLVPRCATSRAVNIYGDAPGANANVCTWTTTKHGTQTWIPEYVESMGGCILYSAYDPSLVLTATGNADGSNVCVRAYNGSKHQIWTSDALAADKNVPTNLKMTLNKSSYTLGDTVTMTPSATGATLYNLTLWDGGAYNKGSCVFEKWNFTGSVSYKPQKAGTYCIRMDAKNGVGRSSIEKTFTVSDVPCSLSFANSVSSLNIGESKTLNVNLAGTRAKTIKGTSSSGAVDCSFINLTGNVLSGTAYYKLTGKSAGTSTITISLLDENDRVIYSKSLPVTVNPLRVSGVSLNQSSLSMTVGQSQLLSATVSPSNATNRAITWSSSNSNVASVSGGAVTARNPGTATITATADGKSASCQVTVKGIEVSHVTIDRASAELRIGDTIQLNASVYPSNAADRSVSWSSNNSAIAAVSSTGLVTAKSEGLVRIWARAGGKEEYCSILVVPREVEGLTLSASELELSPGENHMLEASVYPEDAGNSTVAWSSSAPETVRVENGWLTALKPGKAVITARAGAFSKTCTVTVSEAEAESLRISESFLEIAPGETKYLSVEILPESSANRSVSWSSSDREIAVVENGQITGVSPGFVKITAACGRLEAACYVRVLGEDDGLLDPTEENEFIDVPNGAYFSAAVDWAVEKGITAGTDRSHFSPNQVCTRAQAVTFLWRAAGSPKPLNAEVSFTDISENEYYYDAVIWAAERGITGGVGKNRFAPNEKCTRAQIVSFLHRMEGMPEVSSVSPFRDVPPTVYYANSVAWAVENGITAGTSATTFSPHNDCSRGQIVTFLYRFLG